MFQHTAGRGIVGEKLRPIFLRGNGKPHRIFRHGEGRIALDPVIAKTGDMQHLLRRQINLAVFLPGGGIVRPPRVQVIELAPAIPVNRHFGRH